VPSAINVSAPERWVSALGGAALAALGVKRLVEDSRASGVVMTTAAAGLIWRGATGHCNVYASAGINTADSDTRSALGGRAGVNAEEAVTINRPAHELYRWWRSLTELPRVIPDLKSAKEVDDRRSHWVAQGPTGRRVEWDAEIINDIPGELIAWRTVGASDLVSAGSVHFDRAAGNRGTIVRIRLQYDPPGGKAGALAAWMLGHSPSTNLREGLRRFKQLMETGEIVVSDPRPKEAR
jgi:uncharacterized membrane protein